MPKGKYICFDVSYDNLHDEIQKVYQYAKDEKMPIHFGFDYEEYITDQDYTKEGARLNFCLKLEIEGVH